MVTLADMEGGETFDASMLGQAEEVVEERVADDHVLVFKGFKQSRAVSGPSPGTTLCWTLLF